jgi:ubiquinone/menaquinone biosynthesis C-methylase UbiE
MSSPDIDIDCHCQLRHSNSLTYTVQDHSETVMLSRIYIIPRSLTISFHIKSTKILLYPNFPKTSSFPSLLIIRHISKVNMSSSTHDTTLSPAMQSAQAQWHSTSVAEKYLNAEKATRPFAQLLISKSNLSSTTSDSSEESPYILDLACGTGAAVQEIYNAVPKQVWGKMKVYGGDVSQGMVEYLAHRGKENAWVGLDTGICDGNEIGFPDNTFTHSICTFGVFIMPKSLSELFRVTKKGGWVGVTTWILFQWYVNLPYSSTILLNINTNPISSTKQDPPCQQEYIPHALEPLQPLPLRNNR